MYSLACATLIHFTGDKQTVTPVPRAVFGVPLDESLDVAQICNLPAIIFRAIQYLEAKEADQEEGIYRLSGSSAVIKSLKDRFNLGSYLFVIFIVFSPRHSFRGGHRPSCLGRVLGSACDSRAIEKLSSGTSSKHSDPRTPPEIPSCYW
jgi:hypothetical protein